MKRPLVGLETRLIKENNRASFGTVALVAVATAISQGVVFLSYPFLATIYAPEDFGAYAIYSSLSMILGVVATLRYEIAIPIAEDEAEAANVVALCVLSSLAVMAMVFAVSLSMGKFILRTLKTDTDDVFVFIGIAVFEIGLFQVATNWAIRNKRFSGIAGSKLVQGLVLISIQVSFGLLGFKRHGLIVGDLASKMVCIVFLGVAIVKEKNMWSVNLEGILKCARRYSRFPKISLLAAGINGVTGEMPVFVVSSVYGAQSLGLMSMAIRIAGVPMQFLAQSVSQVYWKEFVSIKRTDEAQMVPALRRATLLMAAFCVPFACILILFGPGLLPKILGLEWIGISPLLPFLVPLIAFQAIASPIGVVLDVLERQDIHLIRECFRMILFAAGGMIVFLATPPLSSGIAILMVASFASSIVYWLASYFPTARLRNRG